MAGRVTTTMRATDSRQPCHGLLANQAANTGDARSDTYVNIENIEGTPFNDTLIGDNQSVNTLNGIEGDDRLFGGGGYAVLIGGPGADQHVGGSAGADRLRDLARGADCVAGKPGINTNDAQGDTYQNLWDMAGTAFDDTLIGDGNNNNFLGNGGNDAISLGAGNDTANGGTGADTLTGGRDADQFAFGGSYIIYDPNIATSDPLARLVHNHPLAVIAEGKAGIIDRITDFNQGNGGYNAGESDLLKVANLVAGDASKVRLVQDASNTFAHLQIDIDGGGAEPWVTIARLDGLHTGDVINVMLDDTGTVTKFTVDGGAAPPPPPPPPPSVRSDVWLLSNGKWAGSVDPGGHPVGYHIAGTGDFNRDGTNDLLWFNPTTMHVDVWTLANGKWAGSTDIGRHPAG